MDLDHLKRLETSFTLIFQTETRGWVRLGQFLCVRVVFCLAFMHFFNFSLVDEIEILRPLI